MTNCALLEIQHVLGKKWTILILQELHHNEKRNFNQLSGILKHPTNRVLSQRLQELESGGLIQKKILREVPRSVEYSLTEKGTGVMQVFDGMKKWGNAQKLVPETCCSTNCADCEKAH